MSNAQGRASIYLCTPNADGRYSARGLASGLPFDEAYEIVLRLIGGRPYTRATYMSERFHFGDGLQVGQHLLQEYYEVVDPYPEIDPDGNYRRPAPERWLDPTVQS